MNSLILFALCAIGVISAASAPNFSLSANKAEFSSRIIGGNTARAAQFPWQVGIAIDTTSGHFFCGGSIVSAQWVLSAAHCLYMGRLFTIYLGSHTLTGLDPNRILVTTSNFIEHPGFNDQTYENDIGLLRLHMPLQFNDYIKPIRLARLGELEYTSAVLVAGWGQTSDSLPGQSNILLYTSLLVISYEECLKTYGSYLKSNMICAVGNFNEGICIGDTGSPLTTTVGFAGEPIQVAVSLFTSQNGCESTDPSGFTRVDLYRDWIANVTGDITL